MASASYVRTPAECEVFIAGPFEIVALAKGGESGGLFEAYVLTLGAGGVVDFHVHETMDETLYVLEGDVEFQVRKEKFLRQAGSIAFVPRGVHHGFANQGVGPARVHITFTPSRSQDDYFRALQSLFAVAPLDKEKLIALQKKYDQVVLPADAG